MRYRILLVSAAVMLALLSSFAFTEEEDEREDLWEAAYGAFIENNTLAEIDLSDDNAVLKGNIFEDYFGFSVMSAADVNLKAWAVCDKTMFVAGEVSTISVYTENGTSPYTVTYEAYQKPATESGNTFYWLAGPTDISSTGSFSITAEAGRVYYCRISVVDADGNYMVFGTSRYKTVTKESLTDTSAIGGKVKWIVSQVITPGMSDYEKAYALHDWLIYNANYDETRKIHDPEGVLLGGSGVCESYAMAYQMLLSEVGIESIYLTSSSMNHAWNMIRLESGWYHVDVTFDDPVGGGFENHDYFCLSDSEMAEDHSWGEYDNNGMSPPASGDKLPKTVRYFETLPESGSTVQIAEGGSRQYRFTAVNSGTYTFSFAADNVPLYCTTYDNSEAEVDNAYRSEYSYTCHLNRNENVFFDLDIYTWTFGTGENNQQSIMHSVSIAITFVSDCAHTAKKKTEAVTVSCTSDGITEYYSCDDCGAFLISDGDEFAEIEENSWIIPALNHADKTKTEAAAATCGSDGNIEYWFCNYCGAYLDSACEPIADNGWFIPRLNVHHLEGTACIDCRTEFTADDKDALMLPDNTMIIENEAFAGTDARIIIIPDSCETIGSKAFVDCPDLQLIFLPASLEETIPSDAFTGSPSVEIIYR